MAFHKSEPESTLVKSTAKFNSKCEECESKIYADDEYYYDWKDKKAYCTACGLEMQS